MSVHKLFSSCVGFSEKNILQAVADHCLSGDQLFMLSLRRLLIKRTIMFYTYLVLARDVHQLCLMQKPLSKYNCKCV